jgi:hypothetical protein
MHEIVGDIWEQAGQGMIAITTNGSLTKDGRAIFGRGVARQAVQRFPGIAEKLGTLLSLRGSHVYFLGCGIISFPVEETAWSLPDLRIIARSAQEIRALADAEGWPRIIVPRPGCGGGGLAWQDVKPIVEPWLDDRFLLVSQPL